MKRFTLDSLVALGLLTLTLAATAQPPAPTDKPAEKPEEKIEAIYDFVSQKISTVLKHKTVLPIAVSGLGCIAAAAFPTVEA